MELRHLRYFVVAADEMHFARAAERLGIAPPTLTVQIQELERALAAKLFTRARRAVALTSAGEVFLTEAREVLARFGRAENMGRRAGRGEVGRIELGYVGSAVLSGVLQAQVSRYRAARPGVEVRAQELPMANIVSQLGEGVIDVGFVRLPMALPPAFGQHVLSQDEFCVAIPADRTEFGHSKSVRSGQLAGESFVVPEQDAGTHEVARRGRFTPNIVGSPGNLTAVLTRVSLGSAIAIVPSVAAATICLPGVQFQRLAGNPITSEVAAVFRKRERSPATQTFIRQITQTEVSRIPFAAVPPKA